MCLRSIKSQNASRRSATLLCSLYLLAAVSCCEAQILDVDQQARESQDRLAEAIAAVDSELLRTRLVNTTESEKLLHWYAGEVTIDGQWLTLPEAEQRSREDQDFSTYLELRQQATDCFADHDRLARWCKKHDLEDQANMHWLHVLRFDSTNKPALKELGLTRHKGNLVTEAEAKRLKERSRNRLLQKKTWQRKIKRLRNALDKNDEAIVQAAREELLEIKDPAAVPALLDEFARPAKNEEAAIALDTDVLSVLGGIKSKLAIETIARSAIKAPHEDVRYSAINQLKQKPYEEYIPYLVSRMKMPIDASVDIQKSGSRVVTKYSYTQEQPDGTQSTSNRSQQQYVSAPQYTAVPVYTRGAYVPKKTSADRTIKVPKTPGHGHGLVEYQVSGICRNGNPFTETRRRRVYGEQYLKEVTIKGRTTGGYYSREYAGVKYIENPKFSRFQQIAVDRARTFAQRDQASIKRRNRAIEAKNERVATVLTEVTGELLSAFPKSWWNWWGDYLDAHPEAATAGTRRRLNAALLNQQQRGLSRGTWVWTQRGKKPVETVMPGDYVLSQEPRTGELAYKLVMAVALPQPLMVSRVEVGDSELHCAPGHVAWATGSGWQRISNLDTKQSLHGVAAESAVGSINEAFEIDSYDLIVDGFHTFFAGEHGILVHDATPIGPTYVALPGFSAAAVAQAAQLAANGQ